MSRRLGGAIAALALATLAACSDVTSPASTPSSVARLAGGSGGGGGGGGTVSGGGGGGSVRPCAILTLNVVNNAILSSPVAPYWQPNQYYAGQAVGSTEKSCDSVPGAVMRWTDESNLNDGCNLVVNQFVGATYVKYGLKPMSRFDQFFSYYTGDSCLGTTRTIRATLWDDATGRILSTMTTTWIVG